MPHLLPHMPRLRQPEHAAPQVRPAASAVDTGQRTATLVLVTEQEVLFSTAAALAAPAASHRYRLRTTMAAAISQVHFALPAPRPRLEPFYIETARLRRELERL